MRNKILSAIAALSVLATVQCFGQGRGIDAFGVSRSIVLAPPQLLLATANPAVTNAPIDIHSFDGIACVDVFTLTNTPTSAALTLSLQTSADLTNWTALQNYALSTTVAIAYTNLTYGSTNLSTTNTYAAPGTFSTVNTATAGYAPPSSNLKLFTQAQFTNTAATITVTASGLYKVGFNAQDANRYLRAIWTPTGATNDAVNAVFTGYRNGEIQ